MPTTLALDDSLIEEAVMVRGRLCGLVVTQASRSRAFPISLRWPFVLALAVFLSSCSQKNDLTGKWQCSSTVIAIYADGVASYSGAKAAWVPVGSEAIRIEYEAALGELRVTGKKDGLRTAKLSFGGIKVDCSELATEEGK